MITQRTKIASMLFAIAGCISQTHADTFEVTSYTIDGGGGYSAGGMETMTATEFLMVATTAL